MELYETKRSHLNRDNYKFLSHTQLITDNLAKPCKKLNLKEQKYLSGNC